MTCFVQVGTFGSILCKQHERIKGCEYWYFISINQLHLKGVQMSCSISLNVTKLMKFHGSPPLLTKVCMYERNHHICQQGRKLANESIFPLEKFYNFFNLMYTLLFFTKGANIVLLASSQQPCEEGQAESACLTHGLSATIHGRMKIQTGSPKSQFDRLTTIPY